MTPLPYCYFDHYQSDDPAEPVTYSGLTMLSNVYGFEPVPEGLAPEKQKYISGAQGNLWTEYVPAAKKAEYMIFPRSTALAEVTWSKPEHKNYRDFINRLYAYNKRLDFHHVNYSKHMFDIRLSNMSYENGKFVVRASVADTDDKIYYTVDGSRPNLQSPVYNSPIPINKSCMVTAAIIKDGEITDLSVKKYVLHKGVGKKSTVQIPAGDNYNKAGIDGWHNGSLSDDTRKNDLRYMDEDRYNSDQWSGWYNQQFNGTIDLEKQERIENVSIRFYHNVPHGILIPKSVSVQTSDDGVNFKNVATQTVTRPDVTGTATVKFAVRANARYVRVIAEPYGKTPRGNYAWLFVDEVIVE
jgi:hexosaminidase